ncbi:MAG: cation:proton antiporter, partial [Cytophagales bacterium]|nr:cation:proton antiporter [Cytophaga sp.]
MDTYVIILTIIGIAALAMAWLPQTFSNIPFSYPVVFILFGALLTFLPIELPVINISTDNEAIIHLSELSVIVSLMGTGVKIDTRFGFKRWRVPLRLVTITMVLCIVLMTLMGMYLLQLPLASALLLGAVLAPTDPVLASDVQVGPPNEKEENHVKFALTAEAGLNDGMAFPFTWLAILLAASGVYATTFQEWAVEYVLMKIVIGTAAGFVLGKFISFLIF